MINKELEELVKLAKNGNTDVISTIIKIIHEELNKIAVLRLGNIEDAKDAVQEAEILICNNIKNLKEEKYFRTWAVKILINECNKIFSGREKEKGNITKMTNTFVKNKHDISDIDEKIYIKQLINELNEDDKVIIRLYLDGYKTKEIADILNMNENSIKTKIRRAKNKMKDIGNVNKYIKTAMLVLLITAFTTGLVYAAIKVYEIIQTNTKTDFYVYRDYDYTQDMKYSNSMYYKKIYTFDEYIEAKKIWNNLVEMEENDFEQSFVVVLAGENYNTMNLYISDIYKTEQKLCIELRKRISWDDNTIVSGKIPKELDMEEIEIINIPNDVNVANQTKNIDSLTEEYTIEEALKDDCFVIKLNKIVSNNSERLNNFVNNCNKNIEDSIRIYIQETERIIINDLEYKNNQINMVTKILKSNNDRTLYNTGNKIGIIEFESYKDYILYNEIGGQRIICSISI